MVKWDSQVKDGYKRSQAPASNGSETGDTTKTCIVSGGWDGKKTSGVVEELLKNAADKAYGTNGKKEEQSTSETVVSVNNAVLICFWSVVVIQCSPGTETSLPSVEMPWKMSAMLRVTLWLMSGTRTLIEGRWEEQRPQKNICVSVESSFLFFLISNLFSTSSSSNLRRLRKLKTIKERVGGVAAASSRRFRTGGTSGP